MRISSAQFKTHIAVISQATCRSAGISPALRFFVKRTLMNLKRFLIASDFLCCYNNNHEKDGRQMHEREKAVGL